MYIQQQFPALTRSEDWVENKNQNNNLHMFVFFQSHLFKLMDRVHVGAEKTARLFLQRERASVVCRLFRVELCPGL